MKKGSLAAALQGDEMNKETGDPLCTVSVDSREGKGRWRSCLGYGVAIEFRNARRIGS